MSLPQEAICPLPDCGKPLYFTRSFVIPVDDSLPYECEPRHCVTDGWEVTCENDHRLDSGDSEHDGRDARIGWRRALSIGGLR